jgi:hypothetical protein
VNEQAVVMLMALVKGCWQDQATDRVAHAAWCEVLAEVSYAAARRVVLDLAKAGEPRPWVGMIRARAAALDRLRADDRARQVKALAWPKPTAEERARVKQIVAELLEKLDGSGRRGGGGAVGGDAAISVTVCRTRDVENWGENGGNAVGAVVEGGKNHGKS